MSSTPVDPERCPLCGEPNECGMAAGKGTCWCHTVTVPATVREAIPAEAIDLSCVCRKCLESYSARP